jgi:hypothetical protein
MNVLSLLVHHFVASSLMEERALRWPRYALVVLATWFVARVLLPDAWHYRRDDPGGLFFVLCMLALFLGAIWLT